MHLRYHWSWGVGGIGGAAVEYMCGCILYAWKKKKHSTPQNEIPPAVLFVLPQSPRSLLSCSCAPRKKPFLRFSESRALSSSVLLQPMHLLMQSEPALVQNDGSEKSPRAHLLSVSQVRPQSLETEPILQHGYRSSDRRLPPQPCTTT